MKTLLLLLLSVAVAATALAQTLVPARVHTNMIGLVQSPTKAAARDFLEIITASGGDSVHTVVNTVTELAALTRSNNLPLRVTTRGFSAADDRGGATYQWVNSTAATNIYRVAAQGGGRWIETDYHQRWICNVLKAGATPFDDTDDTAAVQRAFDAAAQQSTGGSTSNWGDEPTVYFPSGRYYVLGSVSYGPTSRSHANIAIRGDGMSTTWILRDSAVRATPVFYIQNVRLDIADLGFRGVGVASPPRDYDFGTAIHLRDCEYGVLDRVRVANFSRGIVIDSPSMNWNVFRGLQFEGVYLNLFGAAAQGSIAEIHSTVSGHVWFGPANGLVLYGHYEGSGNYAEFTPAGLYIPAGQDISISMGYNEASSWFSFLGVPLTNRVTLSVVNQTNVTATFTNAHYYVTGYQFTITPEQSVPSDIATALSGTLTVASGNRTNNFLTFNTSSPITSSLSGYTFLMRTEHGAGVYNASIRGRGRDQYANAKHTLIDAGSHIEVFGSQALGTHVSSRTRNVRSWGADVQTTMDANVTRTDSYYPSVINVFPDSTFAAGTNWISANVTVFDFVMVPTNISGRSGILLHCPNKPASAPQYRADFYPLIHTDSLAGRRLHIAAEIWELNHPAWMPTGFTVNSGGSGYVNGTATVTHSGRTVQVTLTTSGGAITAASWNYGGFVTNTGISNLAVTQGSASGGVITPTGFNDRSAGYYARLGTTRDPSIALMYRGEGPPGTLGNINARWVRRIDNDNVIRGSHISPPSNPVETGKVGLRLYFTDAGMAPATATGCEAIFIPYLAILVDTSPRFSDTYLSRMLVDTPREPVTHYRANIGGANWPGASPADSASIFAQAVSTNIGLRLVNPYDVRGWVFHLLADGTADPAGASPGALYFNTSSNAWRVFTGSAWRNW